MGHLTPDRHPQGDFFVADLLDVSPKDDMASMEHPMFALKAGDRRVRTYERNGVKAEIQPGAKGLATIHDKDVWIYCISQLVEAMNRDRKDIDRTIRFTATSDSGSRSTGAFTNGAQALRPTEALAGIGPGAP